MDASRKVVGVEVFDTFTSVIDCSSVGLLISTTFGKGWDMYHWNTSVAFTSADAHDQTFVRFPQNFPTDICPGFSGGTLAHLAKNLYGSKSAPKWWYRCLYEYLVNIGFKSVAGHQWMLIRIITGEEGVHVVAIGFLVDDLLVACNVLLTIENLKQQMSTRFESRIKDSKSNYGIHGSRTVNPRVLSRSRI
jgi:hypothetical protein